LDSPIIVRFWKHTLATREGTSETFMKLKLVSMANLKINL